MPIQTAWPSDISSHVIGVGAQLSENRGSSTTHMTMPPMTSDHPMITRLSRCLPMTLVSRNAGAAVQTKAIATKVMDG